MKSCKYSRLAGDGRSDRIIALLLCLAVLFAAASGLDYDCSWGDDYAAYINDGIAIAGGALRGTDPAQLFHASIGYAG